MSQFTPLNVEQSVARYLSEQLQATGYSIYWHDTEQTEGSGQTEFTLLRNFPRESSLMIHQSSERTVGTVKTPALALFANRPITRPEDRMGIGESLFQWECAVRIDGFADTEHEWYVLLNLLKDWFHIDVMIDLYDYQADINSASPTLVEGKLSFISTQVLRQELGYTSAARYYVLLSTTATFIE